MRTLPAPHLLTLDPIRMPDLLHCPRCHRQHQGTPAREWTCARMPAQLGGDQ
jgi:hypothetical protein